MSRKLFLGAAALVALFFYAPAFWHLTYTPGGDWEYFNALSMVSRSGPLVRVELTNHNPWACGGMDVFSNPQGRLFSPMYLLDLAFSPYLANLLSLVLYSFLGLVGTWGLLRRLGHSTIASALGAYAFVGGSWFGLHFTAGHVTFGSLQLLPGLVLLALDFDSRRGLIRLAVAYSVIFLDGGIYTLVFGFYATVTAVFLRLGGLSFQRVRDFLNREILWIMACVAVAILIISVKLVPMLLLKEHFQQQLQTNSIYAWRDWMWIFLSPWQKNEPSLPVSLVQWQTHEYGSYWGLVLPALALGAAWRIKFYRRLGLAVVLWLWTALAWGGIVNPWTLHEFGPFSDVHVQSRTLILANLFLVLMAVAGFDRLKAHKHRLAIGATLILLVEFGWTRVYPLHAALNGPEAVSVPSERLVTSTTVRDSVAYGWDAAHYAAGDLGSRGCYEPFFTSRETSRVGMPNYRGTVYWERGAFDRKPPHLIAYTPGRISVEFSDATPGERLVINTNWLKGWKAQGTEVRAETDSSGLVKVRLHAARGRFVLDYAPPYRPWIFFALSLGILGAAGLYGAAGNPRRPSRSPQLSNRERKESRR